MMAHLYMSSSKGDTNFSVQVVFRMNAQAIYNTEHASGMRKGERGKLIRLKYEW